MCNSNAHKMKYTIAYFADETKRRWVSNQHPDGDVVPCPAAAAAGSGVAWVKVRRAAAEVVG